MYTTHSFSAWSLAKQSWMIFKCSGWLSTWHDRQRVGLEEQHQGRPRYSLVLLHIKLNNTKHRSRKQNINIEIDVWITEGTFFLTQTFHITRIWPTENWYIFCSCKLVSARYPIDMLMLRYLLTWPGRPVIPAIHHYYLGGNVQNGASFHLN